MSDPVGDPKRVEKKFLLLYISRKVSSFWSTGYETPKQKVAHIHMKHCPGRESPTDENG